MFTAIHKGMSSERKLPSGRLSRVVRLAGLGARTGAGLLISRNSKDAMQGAAEQAAHVLGTLRGLAAKVGQMASYIDGMVPEPQREVYENALRKLRDAAPTSSAASIRGVVEEDLKAPIDKLFAEWEDQPFASASIGQVHRARLQDGREVAVKVQHPGIAKAVESDLQNAGVIQSLVGTLGPKELDPKTAFEEIERRFREELDYKLEAQRQLQFKKLHEGDARIVIPGVILERSALRVLTTELMRGKTLDEAALESEELRRLYAHTLWRFVFKGNLVAGMFNADPHPGNYLFQPDGSIAFLDFGCVQPISEAHLGHARNLHLSALSGNNQAFARASVQILEAKGGTYEKKALEYTHRCFAPLRVESFRITREYVRSLVEGVKSIKETIFEKDGRFVPLPKGMLFMNRLQFGFYSVLARLDVEAQYAGVEKIFLEEAGLYKQ